MKGEYMEELKKKVYELLNAKGGHLPLLQRINELILTNYCISAGGYLTLIPKDVEIYYVNRKAVSPYVDTNMQCMIDPKTNDEIWKLQSGRFGQLYFHKKGSGGIDICLSDSNEYALCCTIKAAEVNEEELWSSQKVRNRLVEIICQPESRQRQSQTGRSEKYNDECQATCEEPLRSKQMDGIGCHGQAIRCIECKGLSRNYFLGSPLC